MTDRYVAGHGLGDAIRIAAVMKQRGVTRITVEAPSPACELFESIRWIEEIQTIPLHAADQEAVEYWESVACPEALHKTGRRPSDVIRTPLTLEWQDFHEGNVPGDFVGSFVAVQPASTLYKHRVLAPFVIEANVVLLGTALERGLVEWPRPKEYVLIDARGHTSVGDAVFTVALADAVYGVESWAAILGGCLGIPVVHFINERADRDLKPHWMELFPTMGFRVHA